MNFLLSVFCSRLPSPPARPLCPAAMVYPARQRAAGQVKLLTIASNHAKSTRSGISCLENLVLSNGSKFNAESWDSLCQCLHDVFSSTTPSQLLTWKPMTGGYSRPPSVDPTLLHEIDGDIGHPPPRHHSHKHSTPPQNQPASQADQQRLFSVLSVISLTFAFHFVPPSS